MYDKIMKYLKKQKGYISFAELMRVFPEAKGEFMLFLGDTNICIWGGCSQEFVEAFSRIRKEERLECRPVSLLLYLVEGCHLDLPLATQNRKYKKPHWYPIVFRLKGQGV